jgi:hypothetical protein
MSTPGGGYPAALEPRAIFVARQGAALYAGICAVPGRQEYRKANPVPYPVPAFHILLAPSATLPLAQRGKGDRKDMQPLQTQTKMEVKNNFLLNKGKW